MKTKYIFVSGGVISGLGKGITVASIAKILKAKGLSVTAVKVDMYLNIDAGTIRPAEHGEVFVTADGIETDQDLGNYERFLDTELSRANYITTGQVYQEVIRRERAFLYDGEDVEAIPHISDEIIRRIKLAGEKNKAEVVIIELGGTVGEYQNSLFFEASRIMKLKSPKDVIHIHVAYLPIPKNLGEMKTKPVQQSVQLLNSMGIQPDFIVGRSEIAMDKRRKERIALFCNVKEEYVISNQDLDSIYEVPLAFDKQGFGEKILEKLSLSVKKKDLKEWMQFVEKTKTVKKILPIAVIGKYFTNGKFVLTDVYISVIEALKHAGWANDVKVELAWIDSEMFEKNPQKLHELDKYAGLIVPGGFGSRGVEGIIAAINYARINKIPYLGLCYGMQLACIEFARNVAGMKKANTTEIDEKTKYPIIHIMPEQEKKLLNFNYGGTMRLGNYSCKLNKNTISYNCYKQPKIIERHRHRYEFNNKYREELENKGLVISGVSPDDKIVEIVELDNKQHPFFVGVQFHPEFKSWPIQSHPLFKAFVAASKQRI